MEIPDPLSQSIQGGKTILFLGAGASLSAKDPLGNRPPTGKELGLLISKQYLGGKFADAPLNQIAEFAISETDLFNVQTFIKSVFEPFLPSSTHKLLPRFKWLGLATTNYDRLIELAYENDDSPLQTPKPFIENGDRVETNMRDPSSVMLLKLHGCITRLSNATCPLILTTDQYITHRSGRSRIFDHLKSWAYENPIVFIGYGIQDSDIRSILMDLTTELQTRPRYYYVSPHIDEIQNRFWESKKITALKGTFDDFMQAIDLKISETWRALPTITSAINHPISSKFASKTATLSRNCQQFLNTDVDYVKGLKTDPMDPHAFYRGYTKEWSPIEQNLDVRRLLADTITADHILIPDSAKPSQLKLLLLKAHAGAGKSVLLRRIAWDASHDYDAICLFLRPSGLINVSAIQELVNLCNERIHLFIDDAVDRVRELQSLIRNIEDAGKQLTIIAAERVNEWNVGGGPIASYITDEYELKYLTNHEIDNLLELLEKHKSLDTLSGKSREEQRIAFHERAGRQLLVALHEATLGKPFEDIIEDEFRSIVPVEAQRIYLSICVLHRLGVGVRAGIIARLHGVRFTDFQNRLFKPLEHVVTTKYDEVVRDYLYEARHPFIAEIVFERILKTQEETFDIYIKCLDSLNIDYNGDRRAFRKMIKGRSLIDLFSNPDLVKAIYKSASKISGEDAYYLHQKGLYEMHKNNFHQAAILFEAAENMSPNDITIRHSRSELLLKMAERARTDLERETLLKSAATIAKGLKAAKADSHAHHTLVKIDILRLSKILATPLQDRDQPEIELLVKAIEKNLRDGLQQMPGDSYLLTAEAEFAKLLRDSDRVIDALRKAFDSNPRASFIATRLAAQYRFKTLIDDAAAILEKALDANRTDKLLHYEYAKHLLETNPKDGELLAYHLQRAFSPGDTNYDAQLLFGRQLFINGKFDDARSIFNQLKLARVSPELRRRLLYPIAGTSRGFISSIEGNYLYINRDGINDSIYAHRENVDESIWSMLTSAKRCSYEIAFNFYGANATNLRI